MSEKILILENVSKYYASGQSVVMGLNNISLSFEKGEFVAVTGESGGGKSTLAKVIAGILPYENGEMTAAGEPTYHYDQSDWERYRCNFISFISQNYDILPGCTVLKNVTSALILTGMDKDTATGKAEEILRLVDLWDKRNRRAAKLSSGQKQRLSIARALAKPAPVLIADEPTGNLDKENSAIIIKLLAAAAKERLVIMITHDFEEAEELATRRITIKEGEVASDVRLRKEGYAAGENGQQRPAKTKKPNLSSYTAFLQMNSRPVWTTIMLFLFSVTAFAIFAFLGTFIVNLDDSFTRNYDPSAFPNGNRERIVVMKDDGAEMTKEDWDTLLSLEHVNSVERYGYLADVNYYYREDTDYLVKRTAEVDGYGQPTGVVSEEITLLGSGLFVQTVPYSAENDSFLTVGRLPENMYEVVAAGGEELLNTVIPVYIKDSKRWNYGAYVLINATVVGVTDKGGDLYFDEQLGQVFNRYFAGSPELIAPLPCGEASVREWAYPLFDPEGKPEEHFFCSQTLFMTILNKVMEVEALYNYVFEFPEAENPAKLLLLKPGGIHDSTYRAYLEVEPETFSRIVPDVTGNQVSLTIADYSYTDRVLKSVRDAGYIAISPYRNGSTILVEELASQRVNTLIICLLAAVAVFILQIVVLRAMFGMEIEEFRLLSNLGLRCGTAKNAVLLQILLFTAGGQLISCLAIFFCNYIKIERIAAIVKYLPLAQMMIFPLVHLLASFITAMWLRASITRQVYPFTLQRVDLKLEEEKEK